MRRPTRAIGARLLSLLLAGILAAPVAAAPGPHASGPAPDAAANPTAPKSDFKKVQRKLTKRGKVDASRVPAKPAKPRPQKNLPRLSIPAPGTNAEPGAPLAPAPAVPGPAPTMAGLTARPSIVTPPFDGLAHSTTATMFEPPDPWVAVGPDHVVQVVNTAMAVFDRQRNHLRTVDLAEFFGVPIDPVTFNFDPRVIFDSLHGRWIATEVAFDCEDAFPLGIGHGFLDIAVSNSADPLDQWTIYYLQFDGEFPDYPAAGTSTDKVAFGSNVFGLVDDGAGSCTPNGDDYRGTEIDVFDWAQLAVGAEAQVYPVRTGPAQFTARPALAVPASSPTIHGVLSSYTATDIHAEYLAITGSVPGGTVNITSEDLTASNRVGAFREPPIPMQPADGTTTPNQIARAVDERPTDALWQNGRLVWVSTIGCVLAAIERDCVRVTEIETVNRTRQQDFLIGLAGKDVYHGGIGLSMNGALHVTYTRSGLDENPSTHAVYQIPGDTPDAVNADELVKAGSAPYGIGERWGDYTGVAQDPQDPNVVWQTNEVPNTSGAWSTHISPLSTAAGTTFVPLTPTRVLDTRPATKVGSLNRFAHGVAQTWQVTGFPGIPANAVAVTGNVTVVGQTGSGHVSVTPRPTNTPFSSTINFPLSDVRANNVTTPLGPGGTLSAVYIAQPGRVTHLVFDVTGYFVVGAAGAKYSTVLPARVIDTRPTLGNRLTRNQPRTFQIAGNGGVPADAAAVTGNLTVTQQTASGHISLTPLPEANPSTSTLNFPLNDNRANGVTIPLSPLGQVSAVYKASVAGARTHMIFDVTGYYRPEPGGLSYFPLNPGRLMDTRASVMTGLEGPFVAKSSRTLETAGHLGIPPDAQAITGNLTVTQPTRPGHLALTPNPANNPLTSTLNFPAADTRANGITQPLGSGNISIWFEAANGATVHAILDATGYFR